VKSCQLTAGETGRLETRKANVNKEIRTDRAANGGKLTAAEKHQVNRQQNRMSKSIYKEKHNGAVQSKQCIRRRDESRRGTQECVRHKTGPSVRD
jgi:hypothetical protein